MSFEISRVDVWAGELENRPGALSSRLAHIMMTAEANLEFVITRPTREQPGRGVVYLAPLTTPEQEQAALDVGLHKAETMYTLRVVGPDRPGLAAGIAGTLAQASINITGLSAAAARDAGVVYIRFDTAEDAQAALDVLAPFLGD
jgi:hypothetical protein